MFCCSSMGGAEKSKLKQLAKSLGTFYKWCLHSYCCPPSSFRYLIVVYILYRWKGGEQLDCRVLSSDHEFHHCDCEGNCSEHVTIM